jgi:hypothetical protein
MKPNPDIALIYHYDLARALAGEVVDWQAIPVNVQAGREGGDLCRAAADFARRRDLFAMPAPERAGSTPAPSTDGYLPEFESPAVGRAGQGSPRTEIALDPFAGPPPKVVFEPELMGGMRRRKRSEIAAPVGPNPAVEQRTADPEPSPVASRVVPGRAGPGNTIANRVVLRARIADLIAEHPEAETLLRTHWPEGVPTLKHDGHSDAQLQLILAAVRRVEAEVGAGWHPDDGPPPHVNTNPRAEVDYPTAVVDEGGPVSDEQRLELEDLHARYIVLVSQRDLCRQIAAEANAAGRSISVTANPTVRRWSIARAVIAWAASGRSVDELWLVASNLATFEQCRDPSATLGGLISQFTIEQADRLYEAVSE